MILQRFIEGQSTVELHLQLASNRPATLDEAVQKAVAVSAAYQMEGMQTSTTTLPASSVAATFSLFPAEDTLGPVSPA